MRQGEILATKKAALGNPTDVVRSSQVENDGAMGCGPFRNSHTEREYDLIFSGKQDAFAVYIANINDVFVTGSIKAVDDIELARSLPR